MARVGDQTARLVNLSAMTAQSEVVLVNLISIGEVYVLNNGVRGLLISRGLPRDVPVLYNFDNSIPGSTTAASQGKLVKALESCRPERKAASKDSILFFSKGNLIDITGPCALNVTDNDRQAHPDEWFVSAENP